MYSGRLGHAWSLVYTVPVALAITAIMVMLAVLHSWFDSRDRVAFRWFKWWSRAVLGFVGVRVTSEGGEALAPDGSYVFVSNHASLIDIPVLVYTVNDAAPGGLAAHLAAAGVLGLFSDTPRSLGALFDGVGGGDDRLRDRNSPPESGSPHGSAGPVRADRAGSA